LEKALFLEGVCCGIEEFIKIEAEMFKQIKAVPEQSPDLFKY